MDIVGLIHERDELEDMIHDLKIENKLLRSTKESLANLNDSKSKKIKDLEAKLEGEN